MSTPPAARPPPSAPRAANWFVAFPIRAQGWFESLPDPGPAVRRFHPQDLHLTLAFLGAVEERRAHAAFEVLRAQPGASIHLRLERVSCMGRPQRGSALSAAGVPCLGPSEREAWLAAVVAQRDAALRAAGARAERRALRPHVTLARIARRADDATRARALRWAASLDLRHVCQPLTDLALYTWSPRGPERAFEVRNSIPLGA